MPPMPDPPPFSLPLIIKSPIPDPTISDEDSLSAWTSFLLAYARGEFPENVTPTMPPLPSALQAQMDDPLPTSFRTYDTPIYSSTQITPELTREIREFYVANRYLPPPRAPLEGMRENTILEYDLYSVQQRKNLQAATDLMFAFFPGTICTFSLFRNRIQTHFALSGPQELLQYYQLACDLQIPSEHSLCGHAVLLEDKTFFIADLESDWRYLNNPFKMAGFKSYIGASVSLELDPSRAPPIPSTSTPKPPTVQIGTLNICFINSELPEMSPVQEKVLRHITKMLETQLRATWEGKSRTREARAREAISDFIQQALVDGQFPDTTPPLTVAGLPALEAAAPLVAEPQGEKEREEVMEKPRIGRRRGSAALILEEMSQSAEVAVRKIRGVLDEIDSVQIIDLRAIIALPDSNNSDQQTFIADPDSPHPLQIIASNASFSRLPALPTNAVSLILAFLHSSDSSVTFRRSAPTPSGLEPFLPPKTQAHIAMPFFTDQDPIFLILAATSNRHYDFRNNDSNIIRTIGSIMRAQAVQTRSVQANAAKTAFLSSISHELRTPMHGVLLGLQLASDASEREDWESLRLSLSSAEASGRTLQHILNDVLDFGSIDRGTAGAASRVSTVNLLECAISTAMDCSQQMEGNGVELIVEYEERDWEVDIDEAGYHRLVANGLSNAIKFCKDAPITVSLTTSPDSSTLILRVIDHGIGIDASSLGRLFLPFTKQNSFSPGVGLGLYISKALVKRMRGQLSLTSSAEAGTVFEVTLPVSFKKSNGGAEVGKTVRRHVVSRPKVPMVRKGNSAELKEYLPESPEAQGLDSSLEALPVNGLPKSSGVDTAESDPLRVLVVDDNKISRKLMLMAVKKAPTLSISAEAFDGQHALEVFDEFHPHLVLTDVSMPIMDGVAAASEMRAMEKERGLPRCQIFAITGLGSSDPRMKAEGMKGNAALDGWLIKGQDKLETIREIMANAELARGLGTLSV